MPLKCHKNANAPGERSGGEGKEGVRTGGGKTPPRLYSKEAPDCSEASAGDAPGVNRAPTLCHLVVYLCEQAVHLP